MTLPESKSYWVAKIKFHGVDEGRDTQTDGTEQSLEMEPRK